MNELREFYVRFITSMDMEVRGNKIFTGSTPLTVSKYPVELYDVNADYVVDGEVRAIPFNILNENLIKYPNGAKEPVTKKLVSMIELNLNLTLKSLLVSFIQNQLNLIEYDFNTIRIHNELFLDVESKKKAAKKLYDEKMITGFGRLISSEVKFLKLSFRANIEVDGEKVPSALIVKHDLLSLIEDGDIDDTPLSNYRRQDKEVLTAFLEHIQRMIGTRISHSVNSSYTTAITLTKALVKINEKMALLETLATGDSTFHNFFVPNVTYSDLKRFKKLHTYATMIPYVDIETGQLIEYEESVVEEAVPNTIPTRQAPITLTQNEMALLNRGYTQEQILAFRNNPGMQSQQPAMQPMQNPNVYNATGQPMPMNNMQNPNGYNQNGYNPNMRPIQNPNGYNQNGYNPNMQPMQNPSGYNQNGQPIPMNNIQNGYTNPTLQNIDDVPWDVSANKTGIP